MNGLPTGRAVRRWTRRRARYRDPVALSDLLSDVYIGALTVAVTTSMVLGGADWLGTDLAADRSRAGLYLDTTWLALLAAVAALAALTGLVVRLGPVALNPAQAGWWLPLPVERRGLLRPAAVLWPSVGTGAGAVLGVAVALVAAGPDGVLVTAAATAGAAVTAACVLAAGLAQTVPRAHRRARVAADTVLAATPVAGLVVVLLTPPAPAVSATAAVVAAGLCVALVVTLGVLLDRRLPDLPDAGLRERGAVAGEALGATLSVDTRALGRALSAATAPARRRRSARLPFLDRVPRRLLPHAALVTSDALLLLRSRRHLVQLAVAACLPGLALGVAEVVPAATTGLLVVGAYVAGLAVTEGARRAEVAPMLDALLPLSAAQARRLRLVVPSIAHGLWSLAVFALLAWRYGGAEWLLLGVLAAPVWAAGAVRAAYRPPPDFSGGLVHTPMGAVPPGAAAVVSKGPDVALLCSAPSLLAVLVGAPSPLLLLIQAGLCAVALAVTAHVPDDSRHSASASSS